MNHKRSEGRRSLDEPGAPGRPDTRTALLEAGFHVFARKGFDGASVRDITREAGANLGSITYHFGSKRALYSEVLKANLGPVVDQVGIAAGGPGTPTERVSAVIAVLFEQLSKNPELPRLILQEVSAGEQPPPEVVALVQRNAGYVMGILRDGQAAGEMHLRTPLFTAVSIVSQPLFMNILAPLLREVGGIDMSDPNTRQAASEHVQAFVRGALRPHEEA
jgi:AcrR family transcriptional regulator